MLFSRTGSFYSAKKHLASQGEKAMYNLIRKSRSLMLPVDLQIELFDKMVKPILLYGCEVWGFGNLDILERTVLKFLKSILNMKSSTPNFMVYGETGVYPVYIDVYCRVISYWATLIHSPPEKLSFMVYRTAYSLFMYSNASLSRFKWFQSVKQILYNCGLSGIWDSHSFPNKKWLVCAVRQKLKDSFITNWFSQIENSSSSINYRIFKVNFGLEKYLVSLPAQQRKLFMQIRTRNHRLPIETGRWHNIDRQERLCNLCHAEMGDEYHYIFVCKELKEVRKRYLASYFYTRPNTIKFSELFNTRNMKVLRQLCAFVNEIFLAVKIN